MNDQATFILINVGLLAAFAWFVYWQINKATSKNKEPSEDEKRQQWKSIVNEVFGEVTSKVGQQSKEILADEKKQIAQDLQNKQQQIEKVVAELRRELHQRQHEIKELEEDRHQQFSKIVTQIKQHQDITKELRTSTDKLQQVLNNNQRRGEWGEYILDDILRTAGLLESVHYVRQRALGKTTVIPDVTLLLPNNRTVAVDVKFPYSAIQKMTETESPTEKETQRKQFIRDVKAKVKQLDERGYINMEEGTLDYAIVFVPNEMLFSYINQECPEVIEYAMSHRIMLVSPFTFLIVARTIMESYRNFMIENNLKEIIGYISDFIEEWGRFEDEFSKFDLHLGRLRRSYDQIATTRYNRMRLRINRIEEYRHGMQELEAAQDKQQLADGEK